MGSWGTGIFENDSAADWAASCASASGLSAIEQAFDALLDDSDPDDPDAVVFIDADDAVHAVTAADALARLLGIERPTNAYCEVLAAWADEKREALALPADLVSRAIYALDGVLSDGCELAQMWAEDGRESPAYQEWRASITELRGRLAAAGGTPPTPAYRLNGVVRRAQEKARIVVPEGTHRLTVRPEVELTIIGQSLAKTRIFLPQSLVITTSLSLEGLTLHAEGMAFEIAGGALALERVTLSAGGSAVFVHGGGQASLRDCELSSDDRAAEKVAAIEVVGTGSRVEMEGGTVSGTTGVYVHDQAHARFRSSRLVGTESPAVRVHAAAVVLEHSELTGGESGLYGKDGARAVLRACTLVRSKLAQVEAHESFVRMVGGAVLDGEDDGIDVYAGASLEVESVRFHSNDIALRVMEARAKLLDVWIEDGRSAAVVAQDDAEIDVQGGAIHARDSAALEAFDRGVIRARGVVCTNTDEELVLAYDDGRIEYEPADREPTVGLDDGACWKLIAEARLAAPESRVAAHLTDALARTDIRTITRFDRFVRERVAEAYRADLLAVAHCMRGGCSIDGFADFLGWLIGQGQERYSAGLLHPEAAAEGCAPEHRPFSNADMLDVGPAAYCRLTGSTDVDDFHEVYARPVPRALAGTPLDEAAIAALYPSLSRFA